MDPNKEGRHVDDVRIKHAFYGELQVVCLQLRTSSESQWFTVTFLYWFLGKH